MVNTTEKPAINWWVYIVKCSDGTFYTGITTDVNRRLHEHNHCKTGASYTRGKRPVELVYSEPSSDRSLASKREYAIKRLTRVQKSTLIQSQP